MRKFRRDWGLDEDKDELPPDFDNFSRSKSEQKLVDEFNKKFDQRKQELENVLDFLIKEKGLKMNDGYLGGNQIQ